MAFKDKLISLQKPDWRLHTDLSIRHRAERTGVERLMVGLAGPVLRTIITAKQSLLSKITSRYVTQRILHTQTDRERQERLIGTQREWRGCWLGLE